MPPVLGCAVPDPSDLCCCDSSSGHGQPAGGLLALMSGPYGPVTQLPTDKERRINVHFRLPFMTKWGQSLVVTGTGEGSS